MGDGEEGEDSILDGSQDLNVLVKDLWQEAHPNKRKRLHDGDRQSENNTKPQSGGEDPSTTQVPVNASSSNVHAGGVPDRLLKNRYPSNSSGPFTILIRPTNISANTKRLNATHTGKVLMTKFKPEQLAHIYSSGKFQNTAIFSSASAANDCLSLGILTASNLTAYIPDSFLSCEGLIRGVPTDFPVEELLTNIKSPHKILDIRRQNRKIKKNNQFELIPTQSVYLRFEGRIRPDQVSLFQVRYPVDPWYAPIKICYQCFMFGHVSLQCKSQPKCIKCGNKKHTDEEVCPRKDGPPSCRNCKGEHQPTDKMCPAFLHEKAISALAAERNISLIEARAILPNSSTASSLATPSPSPTLSDQSFPSLSSSPLPPPSRTPTPIPYS